MCAAEALPSGALYRRCDPAEIPFETTADAAPFSEIVGQDRAVQAVRFGIAMRRDGYNLFAIGPPGVGKQTTLRQFLDSQAPSEPTPPDWCYVHNFEDAHRPRAMKLPPGRATKLRADMEAAVGELHLAMRAAFDGDAYRTRKQQLVRQFEQRQERAFTVVRERSKERRVGIVRTETGYTLTALRGAETLELTDFDKLPKAEQAVLEAEMERTSLELDDLFRQFHDWGHDHQEALTALDREIATGVARQVIDRVRDLYSDLPAVISYLADLEADVIDTADDFLEEPSEGLEDALRRAFPPEETDGPSFQRYKVNALVDNGGQRGAPVVYEDNPTYANLIGRIEHASQFGALVTNFTLIKPGALHRARGGYLLLEASKVLQQPFAWEALKRAIRSHEVRIEALGEMSGVVPTVTLEPEPIDFDRTKVILFGEHIFHHLLAELDPEFPELFKVLVDFDDIMDRGSHAEGLYAKLIASLAQKDGLRALDRSAVARVIEHAARLAEDAEKLSVHMRRMVDLLREADFDAGTRGDAVVSAKHVEQAIDAQLRRAGRVRERMLEAVVREIVLIDSAGEKPGQVNGLTVIQIGEHAFGHPTRITARVRAGKGEVTDIEREIELGGPIHSKGVLILTGFLGQRYAPDAPLSLSASLVFEQSYTSVEGDSASLAEVCTLLSALANVPVKQSLAVTGSINQHGRVQAIGGVNEKIEGFFDVCRARGLTGAQGVIIPRSNVKHLMLRRDVVEAVERGQFSVFAVDDVDDAIALLTGRPAGARDAKGRFPAESVNALVEARLMSFAESARAFSGKVNPPSGDRAS